MDEQEMNLPTKITPETPPQFPCWLFLPNAKHGWFRLSGGLRLDVSECGFTHWHPDQPTAPTSSPGETGGEYRGPTCAPNQVQSFTVPPPAQSQTPLTDQASEDCTLNPGSNYVPASFCRTLETALAAAKERVGELTKERDKLIVQGYDALAEMTNGVDCGGGIPAMIRLWRADRADQQAIRADRDALAEKLRELEERWAVREETLTRVLGERDELEAGNKQVLLDLDEAHTRLAALQQQVGEADKLAEALERMRHVVEAAGVANLTQGVQLGQISWFHKMTNALIDAKAALESHRLARQPDQTKESP